MIADFTVTINNARKPLATRIVVHDSARALRSAATRYDRRVGSGGELLDGKLLGVCHRFHLANTRVCAIVRLAPPNLGIGLITHELCHAAVWMHEIEHKFEPNKLTGENDEWFCWILGELVRCTVNGLYERGVYPTTVYPHEYPE